MNEEQYRRTVMAIKYSAVDDLKNVFTEKFLPFNGFDDVLEIMLTAEKDLEVLEAAYGLVQDRQTAIAIREEIEAEEQMQRMRELSDDIPLVNAQLDADAGTKFKATEPPDDAEADGIND